MRFYQSLLLSVPIALFFFSCTEANAINKIKPIEAAKQKIKDTLSKPEKPTELRDKWALIVALDSFHDKSIKPIKFAQNNALVMSALLANPEIGRFGPKHVLAVTNLKAIQKNISKCLAEPWLLKHALPKDLVLLYFCTRYMPTEDGEDLRLCFYEAEKTNPEIGTIKLKETLKEIRRRTQSPYIVSILDISPVTETPDDQQSPELFKKIAEETGTTILAGNSFGKTSYHSSVDNTSFLVANLIEGFKAGDGGMDFETIYDYVKKNVQEQAQSRKGKNQVPVFFYGKDNEAIAKVVPAIAVKSSKQERIRVGHSLSKYPELAARELARQKKLAQAQAGGTELPPSLQNKMSKVQKQQRIPIETTSWSDEDYGVDDDAAVGEVDFGPYMKKMKMAIQSQWVPPKGFKARTVVAVFSIMRDGQITNAEIVDGSGVESVDKSAMKALKAAKLDPLPKGAPPYVQIRYQFDWHVSRNK